MELPLRGLRIVATKPPHTWMGGLDFDLAAEMAEELRILGATVLDFDTVGFIVRNELYMESAVEAVKAFRPDVAISLPNAGYALLCTTLNRENVFRDILHIPTLMLWDHGLLQLARIILDPPPRTPAEASLGSLRRLRKELDHPLFVHYSPDRGHAATMAKLGVIEAGQVRHFLQPAYPNFVRNGELTPPPNVFGARLAFAGNVYPEASRNLSFRQDPVLAGIEDRVLAAKRDRLTDCLWDLLTAEIDTLDGSTRERLHLDLDSSFFWSYLHDEIEVVGNTAVRLAVLAGLKRECGFFGNFIEPQSASKLRNEYGIAFQRSLDYFTELPLLFQNSEVIVDVINLGYQSGVSPKVIGCMACGGLALFDYKDDFFHGLGDIANQVMYRSVDHLNSMVDDYLAHPQKRRDVSRYLQHRVRTEFSFSALCKRILVEEPVWRD